MYGIHWNKRINLTIKNMKTTEYSRYSLGEFSILKLMNIFGDMIM